MPVRLMSPTVGLMPTSAAAADGHTIDPSVSVPTPMAARLAAIAAPVPELDPHALRSRAYGFFTRPPRALQPLTEWVERKFAHSLRFVLPTITTPAARRRAMTKASAGAGMPSSASEPAVVCMRSPVSMLSLTRIGIPCRGPRAPFSRRSRSSASATERASGLTSMIARSSGPRRSIASMRSRYRSVSWRDVYRPLVIHS